MSSQPPKIYYPRTADIRRIVRAAQASGVSIGSIEVGPDGSIRIIGADLTQGGATEFDRLEAAGLL